AEKSRMARPSRLQPYQTLGDLRLAFDHHGAISEYRRELALDTAVARITYRAGGVRYTREVFASHPDQVLLVRLTADRPSALTVSVWIDRLQDATTTVAGNDRLDLVGGLDGGRGLSFQASVKIVPEGGTLETFPERILVDKANAVTLVLAAGTSFHGAQPRDRCDRDLAAATRQPYETLKAAHIADHQRLFRRVSVRLGAFPLGTSDAPAPPLTELPTNDR